MDSQINYKFYVCLDLLLDSLNIYRPKDLQRLNCFDSESRRIKIFKYLNKAFYALMNEMIRVLFYFIDLIFGNESSRNFEDKMSALLAFVNEFPGKGLRISRVKQF